MKLLSVKFSDERNKKYSIQTSIVEEDKKYVIKEAVYSEGKAHIESIYRNEKLLTDAYPDVSVCPCRIEGEKLVFDFVDGVSLQNKYKQCLDTDNKREFERLLDYHKNLILGNPDNITDFVESEEYKDIFGDGTPYIGQKALCVSNFDATAGNILLVKDAPWFIDYEWVYDFPVPYELVLYHCIYDMYIHIDFESFYPFEAAMQYLGITTSQETLWESYESFFRFVIRDAEGSFAEKKLTCLKPTKDVQAYIDDNKYAHTEWEICAKHLEESVAANAEITKLWEESNKANEEITGLWKDCIAANDEMEKNWKETNVALSRMTAERNSLQSQLIQKEEQRKTEVSTQESLVEHWKAQYESVVYSRTWKAMTKIKKVLYFWKKS